MTYRVEFTTTARKLIEDISDRRIREKLKERINDLAEQPDKQGKSLGAELADFRSVRAVGQRYRIIYRVYEDKIIVVIVAVGIRKEGDKKDIYRLAHRLVRLGLLESDIEEKEEKNEQQSEVGTQEHSTQTSDKKNH